MSIDEPTWQIWMTKFWGRSPWSASHGFLHVQSSWVLQPRLFQPGGFHRKNILGLYWVTLVIISCTMKQKQKKKHTHTQKHGWLKPPASFGGCFSWLFVQDSHGSSDLDPCGRRGGRCQPAMWNREVRDVGLWLPWNSWRTKMLSMPPTASTHETTRAYKLKYNYI